MTAIVPALPAIGTEFGLPLSTVQFAVSIYLLGLALAQPVHGMLADRFGRRPVFLWGFAVFTLASLACALSATMLWFTVFRLVQATGIATATVVTRAMFRDTFDMDTSAHYTAYLAGGMGVATMLAPALSGYLIETSGWRMSFYAMTGLALPVFILLLSTLPETRQQLKVTESTFRKMRVDLNGLIESKPFWGYTLVFAFGNVAFFYLSDQRTPVFRRTFLHGSGPVRFLHGQYGFRFYLRIIDWRPDHKDSMGSERTLQFGLCGTFSSAGLILLMLWSLPISALTILSPFLLLFAATGLVNPPSMAGAVAHHPDKAGTASGLSNSMSMAIGALATVIATQVYDGNILSLCLPVVIAVILSVLSYLLLISTRRE